MKVSIRRHCVVEALLLCLVLAAILPADGLADAVGNDDSQLAARLAFAHFLMDDRDYFRAISVYKELLFLSDDSAERHMCLEQIARAYQKSNRYRASIRYLSRLFNEPDVDPAVLSRGRILLGLNYYGMRVLFQARHAFQQAKDEDRTGFALTYLALIEAERGNWNESSTRFGEAAGLAERPALQALTRELEAEVLGGTQLNRRSPTLAAIMSAIIPGSGQYYCGHTYDALQAFLYVGVFSLGTYAAYRYDRYMNDNYVATAAAGAVTSLFHAANIIGAHRVAGFYNLRRQEVFMDGVRVKVFGVDF